MGDGENGENGGFLRQGRQGSFLRQGRKRVYLIYLLLITHDLLLNQSLLLIT